PFSACRRAKAICSFVKRLRGMASTLLQGSGCPKNSRSVRTSLVGQGQAAIERGALGVVADDCRFENEAVAVRAFGGTVLRLDWPGFAQIAEERVSEHGIADAYPVLNDGEPETLFERLDFVVRRMVAMTGHSADCHSDFR
ncbi:hypothetical protein MKK75_08615, partial [Methylobacterium sp. J-030]|uniref:hypothetical protein n=1 Tax=Methylobacterium sp. J-030 TaxID=2836627 RepID=UPI001FB8EFA7